MTPDWSFVAYGLLAIAIAVSLSSVELLTRYQSRSIREIFWSRHYLFFALLNAVFCSLVYWALPYLTGIIVKPDLAETVDEGLVRAIAAGLGYLVIARSSILDITTKDGATYGAGFDAIYNGLAQYLLEHHRRQMRKGINDAFKQVYQAATDERVVFKHAASMVMAGLDTAEEQAEFKARLDLADANFPNHVPEYCFTVYQLIRDYTTGPEEAAARIEEARQAVGPAAN